MAYIRSINGAEIIPSMINFGYANIETFAYGEIPINALGKDFTEHGLFQTEIINDKVSIFELSHRFMLEQR